MTSAGTEIVGSVVSTTVMVWSADTELPHSSVTVHVRTIVFVLPQAAVSTSDSVMVTVPQVSAPVATPVLAEDSSSVHSIVISAGTLIVGSVVSTTVMVWSADTLLPHSSVTVQVLTIVFVLPQAAVSTSDSVMVTVPQVSAPVATPVLAEDSSSVHSIVTSAGTLIVGSVVSTTVMVWSAFAVLPQLSVIINVRSIVTGQLAEIITSM